MKQIGFIPSKVEQTKAKESEVKSVIVPCTFTHAAIVGETGCGKTTSIIYPNMLDRMKRGHGIFVVDFKSCEHQAVKALAIKANRLKD